MRQRFIRFRALGAPLLVVAVWCQTGCAPLPPADARFTEKTSQDLAATTAFAAPSLPWPDEKWWTSYQDEQLNQLMQEALMGSPDLAIAQARVQRAQAMTEVAGAPLLPQISAAGAVTAQRLGYNFLTP